MLALSDSDDPALVADWVELQLCLGEESLSKSKLASLVADASRPDGESFISDVWRHLQRRGNLYQDSFYEVESDLVTRSENRPQNEIAYKTCLFYSLYGAPTGSSPKLFERLSAEAIHRYIGEVFVFGWPPLPDVETAIGERVKQVSALLCERFIESPASHYKDRGTDVIGWKSFQERDHLTRRSSQLVLLVQCAAGHDWPNKTMQLPTRAWSQYIHWAAEPLPGFSVPCVVSDAKWHDVSVEAGIVFDRARIINLLTEGIADASLLADLDAWIADRVREYTI